MKLEPEKDKYVPKNRANTCEGKAYEGECKGDAAWEKGFSGKIKMQNQNKKLCYGKNVCVKKCGQKM